MSPLPGCVDDVSSAECDVDSLVVVVEVILTVAVVSGTAVQTIIYQILRKVTMLHIVQTSNKKQHLNGRRMPRIS